MIKSLEVVLSLRKKATLLAQRNLVEAISLEMEAGARATATMNAIQREISLASSINATDAAVDSIASWLTHAWSIQRIDQDRANKAAADTVLARALLTAARLDEAILRSLIDEHRAAVRRSALVAEQADNDETAIRMARGT